MRKIIHDCDGCLLDYTGRCAEFLKDVFGIVVNPEALDDYSLTKWIGVETREEVIALLNRFNSNEKGYFEDIQPLPGAVEAVAFFADMGLQQHAVTLCGALEVTKAARSKNVFRYFPSIKDVVCLPLDSSKLDQFKLHEPSFVIEDNLKNAKLAAGVGHKPFLIWHPTNSLQVAEPPVVRMQTWDDIRRAIEFELTIDILFTP